VEVKALSSSLLTKVLLLERIPEDYLMNFPLLLHLLKKRARGIELSGDGSEETRLPGIFTS